MKAISFATICVLTFLYRADCQVTEWTEPPIATPEGSGTAVMQLAEDHATGDTGIIIATTGTATFALAANGQVPASPDTFSVDSASGVVSITGALDFEQEESYVLEIVATATGDSSVYTAFVTIEITDVNEAPVFGQTEYGSCMDHGAGADAVVMSVTATDEDASDTVTYSITSGNTDGDFDVDGTTGQITVVNALDEARTVAYTLELTATDSSSLAGTVNVYIVVTVDTSDAVAIMSGMFVTTVAFLVARFL